MDDMVPPIVIVVVFVAIFLALVDIDRWLDQRAQARDAARRNQAHPWRREE